MSVSVSDLLISVTPALSHANARGVAAALAMKVQGNGYRSIAGYRCLAGLLVSLGLGVVTAAAADGTSYTEDLTVQRLGQHHVGARFVFRSHWLPQARHRCQEHEDWREGGGGGGGNGSSSSSSSAEIEGEGKLCHFEAVFPRAVGVLLDRFKVSPRYGVLLLLYSCTWYYYFCTAVQRKRSAAVIILQLFGDYVFVRG